MDSHERDRMTFQNTCDIAVDNWDHTRGRGTGCDKNPQNSHQDMLQYMYMHGNRFANMRSMILIVFIHFINIHSEIMAIKYFKIYIKITYERVYHILSFLILNSMCFIKTEIIRYLHVVYYQRLHPYLQPPIYFEHAKKSFHFGNLSYTFF